MKETTLVIYGEEKAWLKRFAEQLRDRTQSRLKVLEFSREELVRSYLREQQVDLAILPETMADEFAVSCEVLYFTEEENPKDERAMYRYRPMSRHLEQILAFSENRWKASQEERASMRSGPRSAVPDPPLPLCCLGSSLPKSSRRCC